jgi:drug/metabolite transporter (DMT)-like permease
MPELSALALAVSAALGWAGFDLARRALAARMSAWSLVVWVTVGALPLIAAWAARAGDWRLEPAYWAPATASVALNVAANFGYFRAFQLSPLSVTLPMLSFTPLFAALLGAAALGERLSLRAALGALLVVAGGLGLGLKPGESRFEKGSVWMLGVALLWSATLLLDKRALASASPYVHALVLNGGVALGGLAALALGARLRELGAARGNAGRLLAAVAVGAAALTLQLLALGDLPVGILETIKRGVGGLAAVLLGRALFGEALTGRKLLAVALMTVGVGLILL